MQTFENWETLDNTYFASSSPGSGEPNFTTPYGNQFAVLGNYVDAPGTSGASGALYYNFLSGLDTTQTYTLGYAVAVHFDQPYTGETCYYSVRYIGSQTGQQITVGQVYVEPGTPVYTDFQPVSYGFTPVESSGSFVWDNYCNGNDYSGRFFVAIDNVYLIQGAPTTSSPTPTTAPTTFTTSTTSTASAQPTTPPALCNNQGLQWEVFTDMGTYYHGPTWYEFEDYISTVCSHHLWFSN